jgi:hypothetical protein
VYVPRVRAKLQPDQGEVDDSWAMLDLRERHGAADGAGGLRGLGEALPTTQKLHDSD